MFIPKRHFSNSILLLVCLNLFVFTSYAQVGIGTVDPDPSSMLDVSSTSQGLLTPRMTTAQRIAIAEPANGLLVYDLDELAFYYFEETEDEWIRLNSSQEKRDNYVLVKSLADFPAPNGSGVITLLTDHYYEINGTINLAGNSINLNNAYVAGLDAAEDVLVVGTGNTAFQGSTGGSIRNITITGGGTVFNITGTAAQNLLLQNTVVANMGSVGSISGLGLYFSNIVQFVGNATGITYDNINNLLLSNQAWFTGNGGVYETFTGTFALIQKVSGFSTVGGGATGINVSSNPTVGEGIILSTLFTGAGTYVNGYTGSYPGYFFNNNWVINSPGIPRESDNEATGNIYFNGDLATGFAQAVPNAVNTPFNLASNTTTLAPNNFRVISPSNNRLTYEGRRPKTFQVNATLAVRANTTNTQSTFFAFFIRKNGTTTLVPTNTVMRTPSSSGSGAELVSLSISGTVDLVPGDYIEVWGQRLTGANLTSAQLAIFAVNMNIQ